MFNRAVCLVLLVSAFVTASAAQTLPPADQVLVKLCVVNDQFLRAWPNPEADIVTDRARPSNIWTRATYFEGLMALHKIAPDPRYPAYAVRWAESHDWNLAYGSTTDRVADDQCCGQTYLDLYALDPRPERVAKIKTAIDNMVNSTKSDDWWWIDALHMAMPVFARLGVLQNDPRYFAKMYDLYSNTRSVQGTAGLYNPVEHLWWRDADFDPPYKEPNGANCYWSRGNGWVFAALARVLDVLPANESHRAEYLRTFQDMAAALVPLQRTDGFWNASLMDPSNYGGRELTGTAMFTYGLAWGINQGHLSRATYLPVVARSWRALAELAVRPDGTLGYVQGSGKQPSDGQPVTYDSAPNFDDFGTGAFLLAGTEIYTLTSRPAVDYVSVFKNWNSYADARAYPYPEFLVRVGGTALAAAFASAPPRVVLPDGNTELPLRYDAASGEFGFYDSRPRTALDAAFPNGLYTVILGTRTIANVRLGFAPAETETRYPNFRILSCDVANAARALTLDAQEFDAANLGERRVRLSAASATFFTTLETRIHAHARPSLTVPPYTFTPGTAVSLSVECDDLSFENAAIDLGPFGSPTVEAGSRLSIWGSAGIAAPTHSLEKLVNFSSRGLASAANPLIAGFVISPGGPKMVLIRAVGPTLQNFGVTGALANPYLRVFNSNCTRAWQDDDWQSTPQYLALDSTGATMLLASYTNVRDPAAAATESGAFPLTPRSRDAALVVVLPPGNYTAQVTPSGTSAAGAALVEVYELTTTQTNPRLTNLSTRGTVSATETLTAGFVITGGSKRVLVRAVGPTLAAAGLPAATTLHDPKLAVFNAAGTQLAENDNWSDAPNSATQAAFRASLGAFPLPTGSKDAETTLTLDPGAYTIRISSGDGGSGTALTEVYSESPGS